MTCRCGHSGEGPHPCHGDGYQCQRNGTPRFIATSGAVAGLQPKTVAYETWACDECWARWLEKQPA